MKKTIILILALVCLSVVVFAQPNQRVTNPSDVGFISPNNPLYFLDVFFDEQKIPIGTDEEKARIRLEIANERLAELESFPANNRVMNEYNKQIQELQKLNFSEQVLERLQNHVRVLERVRNRLQEIGVMGAEKGISNALENSQKVIEKKRNQNI